jgi:hypothetical protein
MPNYDGNPNIAMYGAATRFGQPAGADPRTARLMTHNPHPLRNAVRRIGCAPAIRDEPVTLAKVMRIFPKGYITAIDYVAGALFVAALNGNVDAMNRLELIIDGPLD